MAPGLTDHDRAGPLVPDLSPEARRKEALRHKAGLGAQATRRMGPGSRVYDVTGRVTRELVRLLKQSGAVI